MIRSKLVTLIGAICFVLGAIYFRLHPRHSWKEITGDPSIVPIDPDR